MRRFGILCKRFWQRNKRWFQSALVLAIVIFVSITFRRHWEEVSAIDLSYRGWACLVLATGINLLSYIWTGQVWGYILGALGHSVSSGWAIRTFLLTNIAKYLPSNLLHLYGRTLAAKNIGIPTSAASLSVILDSMLVIASGWILGLLSVPQQGILAAGLGLMAILVLIHPKSLRFFMGRIKLPFKKKDSQDRDEIPEIKQYPMNLLLGEIVYVLLRGIAFAFTVLALAPVPLALVPRLISVYSIAWLMGYLTPGAPGGLGVYEITLIGLLDHTTNLQQAELLGAVAISRLVGTLAEMIGAATAWLDEKMMRLSPSSP
ncbi:lysylphosphatidylglycerol synthase domain-containing protein [Lyngbya confervoides]|uniref:Lysylphosphatidylglycerol synthase domain-containing protein n=1 Tax=Lyngbya confervoides BDU141951 TaxID=1574623 RepID=A0ABD4T0S7_9CYAN|nr:lysylphosphatidylglycerol synthase domain-containing protein [Lyngbya confervoides]MCM1982169.1 lysylphosphatidylglycerol synthase domain-containing protein [Lyngbya confervoides BDU141951]